MTAQPVRRRLRNSPGLVGSARDFGEWSFRADGAPAGDLLPAIEQAYRDHYRRFLALSVAMVGDRERGRDAVQEAFARALRSRGDLRRAASLHAWLWRILVNVCRVEARHSFSSLDALTITAPWQHGPTIIDRAAAAIVSPGENQVLHESVVIRERAPCTIPKTPATPSQLKHLRPCAFTGRGAIWLDGGPSHRFRVVAVDPTGRVGETGGSVGASSAARRFEGRWCCGFD